MNNIISKTFKEKISKCQVINLIWYIVYWTQYIDRKYKLFNIKNRASKIHHNIIVIQYENELPTQSKCN